jgi:hypothetical protein
MDRDSLQTLRAVLGNSNTRRALEEACIEMARTHLDRMNTAVLGKDFHTASEEAGAANLAASFIKNLQELQ